MHELTEKLWGGFYGKEGLDEIITDWLREKAALINFHFKNVTPEGHCYPHGEGILGLVAEKDQCCLPHEPCERCGKEPTPEPRTWPCAHISKKNDKWHYALWDMRRTHFKWVFIENGWNICPEEGCGAKRPETIWCAHIKLKGDTWRYEYISQNDPLISYQVTIEDYENFCRVCGKERPR